MEFPSFSILPNISNFSNFSINSDSSLSKLKNTVNAVYRFLENSQILNSIKKIPETINPLFEKVKQINPSSIMAKFNLTNRKIVVIDKKLPNAPSSLIKTGDLVYGLTGSRKVFLDQHVPDNEETFNRLKGARVSSGKKRAVLADTLNNQFLGTGYRYAASSLKRRSRISNAKFEKIHSYQGELKKEKPEVKEFRVFLEKHPKYNPQMNISMQEVDVRVGRACKGALEFTVKNNRKIHFVLDGLDINRVFKDLNNDKIDRAITGKEIKWLYRHRADDKVKKNVIFYENGQVTDAPWVKNPEQWQAYDQYRKSHEDKT